MYNEEFYTNCSGVKLRKKKKKEKQQDDINSLHYKVQSTFQQDLENKKKRFQELLDIIKHTEVPYGIEVREIKRIFIHNNIEYNTSRFVKKIPYSDYKSIIKEINSIDVKNIENNFEIYKTNSKTIIDKYESILNKPVKINFFSQNKTDGDREELNTIKQEFIHLVNTFYTDLVQKDFIEIVDNKKNEIKDDCKMCGSNDFIEEAQYKKTCVDCGYETEIHIINSEFNDVERVNFSKKYTYKKYIHFRDTLKNFQGKQNRVIDETIITRLENEMIKDGIININTEDKARYEKVKKEHLRTYLDLIGENKHYENINLIYSKLTSQQNYIVSQELEDELMKDFELFTRTFLDISIAEKEIDRTNILSSSYILYQLLKRRGIKVREEEFSLPSSQKCRYKQEYIYSKCCEKLGWNYVSIL